MRSNPSPQFEIHVHGDLELRPGLTLTEIQEALAPLWQYAGSKCFDEGARSSYDEEPGIHIDLAELALRLCWTIAANDSFRAVLEELCMLLNEVVATGGAIEVTFYDTEFDEDDSEREAADDFHVYFVGPTPAAIMQIQRDLLLQDIAALMTQHFEEAELAGVFAEVDKLFASRMNALVNSLQIKPQTSKVATPRSASARKSRRLH